MPRSDKARLRDMLDAAELAVTHTTDRVRADLDRDPVLYAALPRWIEVIGEAANHIDPDTRPRIGPIPWKQIVGMRNVPVHGYYDVDRDRLWLTIRHELPPLIEALHGALDENQD